MHTHIHVKMVRKFCTQHTIHTNKSSDDNSRTLANEKKNRKQNRINCTMYVYGVFIVPIGQIPKLHISYYRFFFGRNQRHIVAFTSIRLFLQFFFFFCYFLCVCVILHAAQITLFHMHGLVGVAYYDMDG